MSTDVTFAIRGQMHYLLVRGKNLTTRRTAMRKWILIILVLVMSLGTASISSAGDRAANGLFFGAGTGALIGQAIGRNADATLLGTAIGGVLGYIVGNEQEKAYAQEPAYYYRYPEPAYRERVVVRRQTVIYREAPPVVYYYPEPAPVFDLSLGWIFYNGRDYGRRDYYRGWRGGGNHWRGGYHHRR
jgi:outer membrane lipoprotein SlyB